MYRMYDAANLITLRIAGAMLISQTALHSCSSFLIIYYISFKLCIIVLDQFLIVFIQQYAYSTQFDSRSSRFNFSKSVHVPCKFSRIIGTHDDHRHAALHYSEYDISVRSQLTSGAVSRKLVVHFLSLVDGCFIFDFPPSMYKSNDNTEYNNEHSLLIILPNSMCCCRRLVYSTSCSQTATRR